MNPTLEQLDRQYITAAGGSTTGLIVPIAVWLELLAGQETTAYLLQSEAIKQRLLEAKQHTHRSLFEDVREKPGI